MSVSSNVVVRNTVTLYIYTHSHIASHSTLVYLQLLEMQNEKWNFNIPDAPRLWYIPAVTFTDDGGKGVTEGRGRRGLGSRGYEGGDRGGSVRHYEPTGTGVLTTWPHPIVRSGITHPVIVSSSLMSLADSGHVSGEKRELGTVKTLRMQGWFAREMKWT